MSRRTNLIWKIFLRRFHIWSKLIFSVITVILDKKILNRKTKKGKNALAFPIIIYTSTFSSQKFRKLQSSAKYKTKTNSQSSDLPRVLRGAHWLRCVVCTRRFVRYCRRDASSDVRMPSMRCLSAGPSEFIHDGRGCNGHYRSFLLTSLLSRSRAHVYIYKQRRNRFFYSKEMYTLEMECYHQYWSNFYKWLTNFNYRIINRLK